MADDTKTISQHRMRTALGYSCYQYNEYSANPKETSVAENITIAVAACLHIYESKASTGIPRNLRAGIVCRQITPAVAFY